MDLINEIIERYPDEDILIANGFDDAILGYDSSSGKVIYSIKKSIDILVSEGLNLEDAYEHFEFNVRGSYVGDKTPIWCEDDF
jgi:hypothetical protein